MTFQSKIIFTSITLCVSALLVQPVFSHPQTLPDPKPDVPETISLKGQFVYLAHNDEGYAVIGYRAVQQSVGDDWILLRTGITLQKDQPNYTLKREHLSVKTPDGTIIPLATQQEFLKAGGCPALVLRDGKITDSIDYLPRYARKQCAFEFFKDLGSTGLAWDQVELSWNQSCAGRLFFNIPGGIVPGQYWLNVQFANSMVQVPFRVMTEAEEQ